MYAELLMGFGLGVVVTLLVCVGVGLAWLRTYKSRNEDVFVEASDGEPYLFGVEREGEVAVSEVMATMVEEGVLKHRSESRRRYVGEESHVP